MALILMIAAGILLAFILLPLLGPIAMILVCVAVIALLGYGILFAIGTSMAAVDAAKDAVAKAKNAKQLSFKTRIRAIPEFQFALSSIEKLLTLRGLQHTLKGLWYRYVLTDRIHNCSMTGIFRVENEQNRAYLENTCGKRSKAGKICLLTLGLRNYVNRFWSVTICFADNTTQNKPIIPNEIQ